MNMTVILKQVLIFVVVLLHLVPHTEGECIVYESGMVGTILSKFGTLECFPLNVRTGEYLAQSNVRSERLHVNGECVNGNDVQVEALVQGHRSCPDQRFLFTWYNETGCPRRRRCDGYRVTYNAHYDFTICMIKCPKRILDGGTFEVELIGGLSYTSWSVCGLGIHSACSQQWTPPANWPKQDFPVVYRSFDSGLCLELMNGASLVSEQISNMALTINKSQEQWASLGDLSLVTCLPKPWTCGSEGASLSVWMKIEDCSENGTDGSISSMSWQSNGFQVRCHQRKLRFLVNVLNGYFVKHVTDVPSGWFHFVMALHSGAIQRGFTVHIDDTSYQSSRQDNTRDKNSTGTVTLGRLYSDRSRSYSSMMMDELTFWNRQLDGSDVEALRMMHLS